MGAPPDHGLKGKENVRSKIFKQEIEPQLAEFFEDTVLTLSGPRPTRFAREAGGDVEIRDDNDIQELDPEWMKRCLYSKYCWDQGHHVQGDFKGNTRIARRVDNTWIQSAAKDPEWCRLWNNLLMDIIPQVLEAELPCNHCPKAE
jgi:hypothetical protein